ncbi:GNAT family N-acetyltransferase [Rubrivivax rivuli]|uniref:GNAT family N-acetyltransferase n=1 Tax=Rubrivivax rivuli TaxID=1862385 RepID=A0A437R8F8_9BURK|nr:GNAT family N-acetyltransferase [Rubrivivax rivuli]
MSPALTVEPLARHRALVPLLAEWFASEWPAWYGSAGQGNIDQDLRAFATSETTLPIGFVAFLAGKPVGACALKAESIPSHAHLSPWASAGFVAPKLRGKGIGAGLLAAMLTHAHRLGYPHVYCGTSTAESLLQRSGWHAIEVTQHAGKRLTVYRSAA